MGIRHLETYICTDVRKGFVSVNIESEIKRHYAEPNPIAPIIVIDLMALYRPVSSIDFPGLLCGGRFNQVTDLLEQFFGKLQTLRAKLVFFFDGPVQNTKYDTWVMRQDDKYHKMLNIINAVDTGRDLTWIVNRFHQIIPNNTLYPLFMVARKYGETIISIMNECDQEMAAYAKKMKAMAIISNDTDFMIYEGFWRYWSAKDINFDTLDTKAYNRVALVKNLGLSFQQMRLFATLGGNDIIKYDEVRQFHSTLGQPRDKFPRLAEFVRSQPLPNRLKIGAVLENLLCRVFGRAAVNDDLKERFIASLDFYDTNYEIHHTNDSSDPVLDALMKMNQTFCYQVWTDKPVNVTAYFLDMRKGEFGEHYPSLVIQLFMRQAGIILYHKRILSDCSKRTIVIKMSHEAGYSFQEVSVQFPTHVEPPLLLNMITQQDNDQTNSLEVGVQLYCWIASDSLDYRRLQPVPEQLWAPVLTLYCLVEKQMIQIVEADTLLQVAHDVAFRTYDVKAVSYPTKLAKRPFRIAFLFLKIYNHFNKAGRLLGFEEQPFLLFDGVLFHNLYAELTDREEKTLDQIKEWRIYADSTGQVKK
ncbi:uncharacterized protein LOC134219690 [Armigeres subalbatus]|uniref:uncharacterized protein LOC134219690 n=1 Tax=Armigeres subalbatus TaxID=124917 RepID=UPI002ED3D2A7